MMRWIITGLLLTCCGSALAQRSWYVAPGGDDAASGAIERPFATIARAQKEVAPGDTVFVRGGTFRMTEAQIARTKAIFAAVIYLDKSGTAEKPITYRAYEDEQPVFDFTEVKPAGNRVSAFSVSGSWLRLVGLEVTGVQVTLTGHTQSICFESNGSHNVFERLRMHDGQAIGIYHVRGSDNLFLNCDAWNNWDYTSEDGKGGNVDGFGCHPTKGSTGNVFRGCRSWYNSDDGYDCLGAQESVTFDHCWAAYNGLSAKGDKLADGNGFKAGGYGSAPAESVPAVLPRHVVRYCIAVGNKNSGFYANHHPGGSDWLNNTAYRNGANFNMLGRLRDNRTDAPGVGHKLVNNLSYGGRRDLVNIEEAKCDLVGNSFTTGLKLTKVDFLGLDEQELLGSRLANGDLPRLQLLRPAPGLAKKAPVVGALEP
jgi:hypothetical protein